MADVEPTAILIHPENVHLSERVYVGHYAVLNGYHNGSITIGEGSWIGAHCFLHGAGKIEIGKRVGIGPGVKIITSSHSLDGGGPIIDNPLEFAPVTIEDGADIGAGAVILPGIRIGKGAQVGAGSVVTRDVSGYRIVAGVPATLIGNREKERVEDDSNRSI